MGRFYDVRSNVGRCVRPSASRVAGPVAQKFLGNVSCLVRHNLCRFLCEDIEIL